MLMTVVHSSRFSLWICFTYVIILYCSSLVLILFSETNMTLASLPLFLFPFLFAVSGFLVFVFAIVSLFCQLCCNLFPFRYEALNRLYVFFFSKYVYLKKIIEKLRLTSSRPLKPCCITDVDFYIPSTLPDEWVVCNY